ncbi:uncharacterized protein LOC143449444 [Clavelina lepadiformis]|uniref:Uncharacterized protein n=1 Tax=Clavelina lepadiformis TaxID=159417 RepID=A0ABP0G746_CLALP
MGKLSDIANGMVNTFSMDPPKKAKPRKSSCRECEIMGGAASFSAVAYVWHLTKIGRIQPVTGAFVGSLFACFGAALITSFPPDSDTENVLEFREKKLAEERQKHDTIEEEST